MSCLIVNSDDFGLTGGVNRAIAELHRAGLVTSSTLMARAAASDGAIDIARSLPSLGVGCHVVLVDGEPALASSKKSALLDPHTGHFYSTLGSFLRQLTLKKIRPAEIEAEAAAQISLLQCRGLQLTHVDSHKHVHMFPGVLRPLLRAARTAGIHTVRNPFEPAWSTLATPRAQWLRRTQVSLLRQLEPAFRRIVREEGFITTDGAIGVLATGTLDAVTIRSLLASLPLKGIFELVTHPGYNDADLAQAHTRLMASRDMERQALKTLDEFPGVDKVTFADLDQSIL